MDPADIPPKLLRCPRRPNDRDHLACLPAAGTQSAPNWSWNAATAAPTVGKKWVGVFQALQGIIAIFENEFYVATRNYTFQFDATTWGWIHLLLGLLVAFAGYGLLSGKTWARVVALTLAVLSATANFLFVPYYPFWALLLVTLNIFVIWAITAHGGELRDPV